ncbi:MAG: hypothetical protein OEW68_08820 [Gammaproteobacteria bacterium]|nr:hypothetical protein [Gammaproteobacteria bacterium]MDH4314929.1 hypothetical protein [Gammaproteobacteria bacterium]MDH5214190.1 hypothetical protein [Gammaproteobacteria bacterium]
MLRWIINKRLDAEEDKLGESMDYLRYVNGKSPAAMLRFAAIVPFANSRKTLPADAWYAAQIVALQHADCGPCLQIGVSLARKDGVDVSIIEHILSGNWSALPPQLTTICQFTKDAVADKFASDELRQQIIDQYGEKGLIELAFAIAAAAIPPTVKRVLGFSRSCSAVEIRT